MTTNWHQPLGPWGKECTCGRTFKSGRGRLQHQHAEFRKRRAARRTEGKAT